MISIADVLRDYEKVSGIRLRTLKFGYKFFRPWIDNSASFYYPLNIYYFIVSILYAEGQVIFKMIFMFDYTHIKHLEKEAQFSRRGSYSESCTITDVAINKLERVLTL